MININTNLGSLILQSNLKSSTIGLNRAIERMTTGFKINHAKDNAAGYSIARNMSVKLSSFDVAVDNVSLGSNLIETASSNLSLITSHLQRMRDLAEQAANGTYGADSLTAIQSEIDARTAEIDRVMSTTEYNGVKLFSQDKKIAVDESKRVVNQTTFQAGETYYLTTSDDLVALQNLTNSGVDTTDVTFELMADIDMQGVEFRGIGKATSTAFKGVFSGNQHVISNLKINTTEEFAGLFGYTEKAKIDSIALKNCDISGSRNVGALVGKLFDNSEATNCYATGRVKGTGYAVGGLTGQILRSSSISNCYAESSVDGKNTVGSLVGALENSTINKSYASGRVKGLRCIGGLAGEIISSSVNDCYTTSQVEGSDEYIGGLIGSSSTSCSISNSYAAGSATGKNYVGGLAGYFSGNIDNSYATGSVTSTGGAVGGLIGTIVDCVVKGYYDKDKTGQSKGIGEEKGTSSVTVSGVSTLELNNLIKNNVLPKYDYKFTYSNSEITSIGGERTLQVGIDSSEHSTLTFDTALDFELKIDLTTPDGALDAIKSIDEILKALNEKQTEFGAVQNRLDSVLEALTISIDNLVSSQSTIRDADIAEESSEYIKYQILQQASATLLATANQAPELALQLL